MISISYYIGIDEKTDSFTYVISEVLFIDSLVR